MAMLRGTTVLMMALLLLVTAACEDIEPTPEERPAIVSTPISSGTRFNP